jgi:hypothetical protein
MTALVIASCPAPNAQALVHNEQYAEICKPSSGPRAYAPLSGRINGSEWRRGSRMSHQPLMLMLAISRWVYRSDRRAHD